jgi:predicted  nucleic acid-binding Zn-ribbon protein
MLILDRSRTEAPATSKQPLDSLRLRMASSGKEFGLGRGRTTIGSSQRCNIPIQEPGIQPLHCLIVQSGEGLNRSFTIRRWAGDTMLNGSRLEESPLEVGDRLKIGSVELAVIGPGNEPPALRASAPTSAAAHPGVEIDDTTTNGQAVLQYQAGRDASRARSRKLLGLLRKERAARREAASESERIAWTTGELEARVVALAGQLKAAEGARQALADKQTSLSSDLQNAQAEVARLNQNNAESSAQKAELTAERDTLRRQVEELHAGQQQIDAEKSRLEEQAHALSERAATATSEFGRFSAECAELRRLAEQRHDEVRSVSCERDDLRGQVEELRAGQQQVEADKSQFHGQIQSLTERAAAAAAELELSSAECSELRRLVEQQQNEIRSLACERDESLAHFDRLQASLNSLTIEKTGLQDSLQALRAELEELESAHRSLLSDCVHFREQIERLQAERLAAETANNAAVEQVAALTSECDRLRGETGRVAELEDQVRKAIADRENTSSELYRALLQLAEMQERDGHGHTIEAANQALQAELEKSSRDVAQLTEQLQQLQSQHLAAEQARQELADRDAEVAEAQHRLSQEKSRLEETIAELRGQLLEVGEREAGYVLQLESADEWKRKFETANQTQAELTEQLTALQARIHGLEQAAAETAHSVAGRDERVAECEWQLAAANERNGQLEHQVTCALEAQRSLEHSRDEWENRRIQSEQQQAELRRQIADLERQLTDALSAQPPASLWAAEAAVADVNSGLDRAAAEPTANRLPVSETIEPTAAAFSWEPAPPQVGHTSQLPTDESRGCDVDWSTPAGSHASDLESADHWPAASHFESPSTSPAQRPFGNFDLKAEPIEPEAAAVSETEPVGVDRPQSTSFIERYSHMFADDRAPVDVSTSPLGGSSPVSEDRRQPIQSAGPAAQSATSRPASADEEDSIEQYMAKLLQRVRGEGQASPASPTPHGPTTSQPLSGPLGYEPSPLQFASTPTASLELPRPSGSGENSESTTGDARRRKPSAPVPQTDLEALRALANESARRAISRHSLRKYRRNAVTKVIVSALAGMTSLWLMLEAPTWTHWQFLGACLSMAVAAFWACETFRTLMESFRIAATDETDEEIREISAELQARLPIDVIGEHK